MGEKAKSFPARINGLLRLIADFLVLGLVGILWVPLQISQHRCIESEPVETEEHISKATRETGKRGPNIG